MTRASDLDAVTANFPADGRLTPDARNGFRFAGFPCRAVVVRANALKGICRNDTGTIGLPEPGPLSILLTIGDGPRYCGSCGGVAKGKETVLFKRKACAAPGSCQ